MAEVQTSPSFNDALMRMGGMYGSAWRDGLMLGEIVEVSATSEINKVEVPLVGTTQTGYKPGRTTREGTITCQKIDAKWEMEVWRFMSATLAERRAARDSGERLLKPFSLLLEYDDPDALGIEKWQLNGCLIWRLPLGFSISVDIVQREFPLTWESETPIDAFEAVRRAGGVSVPRSLV
jgi:hypothetical protein